MGSKKQNKLKRNRNKHRYKEQPDGCQRREEWGEMGRKGKEIKMYKLPVVNSQECNVQHK